ncbi:MAG: prepilin peptidase [Anaerotignaceae bacterium]
MWLCQHLQKKLKQCLIMPANVIVQAVLLTVLLICCAIVDIQTKKIPVQICIGIFLLSFLNFKIQNLLGLGVPLILLLTVVYVCPNKLGGGDIKLCAAISVVMGFNSTAYGVIIGFSIVTFIFIVLVFIKTKQEVAEYSLPLAPFLAVGFLITYFM